MNPRLATVFVSRIGDAIVVERKVVAASKLAVNPTEYMVQFMWVKRERQDSKRSQGTNECLDYNESGKGRTGRKPKLAGAIVKNVYKERVGGKERDTNAHGRRRSFWPKCSGYQARTAPRSAVHQEGDSISLHQQSVTLTPVIEWS